MNHEEIKNNFTYHTPKGGQVQIYEQIRNTAHSFALFLNDKCPEGREKAIALTKLEEAVFWANASIARSK